MPWCIEITIQTRCRVLPESLESPFRDFPFPSAVAIMSISNTRLELERELCQVVAEKLKTDPNQIRMDDDVVVDLGVDSLALAELTVQLEKRMGVKVPGEDWLEVITVGELADLIERHQRSC